MSRKHYGWGDNNIPIIGNHSIAKHRILRRYIERYIEILTSAYGQEVFRLTLVDGFAGGGKYYLPDGKTLHFGSPIILMEAIQEAERRVNQDRKKKISIKANYIFVEKEPSTVSILRQTLNEQFGHAAIAAHAKLRTGIFERELDSIIAMITSQGRAHRAIFVLDQYGYTNVPLPMLQGIFNELPKSEVFLTLAVGCRADPRLS